MNRFWISFLAPISISALLVATLITSTGCGGQEESRGKKDASESAASETAPATSPTPEEPAATARPESSAPADLDQALVLSLAAFAPRVKGEAPKTLPARMEFLSRVGGEWQLTSIEAPHSNVFHKAMSYTTADGQEVILTAAGTAATMKLWTKTDAGHEDTTIWERDFGGKFSRMRDVEVADVYGDGAATMVVATHDQGIVATIQPGPDGSYEVTELDTEPDTFVHEIELGDVDGDGVLEIYATPSEPNKLDGSVQSGHVVRYVPAKGEGRTVVADLGDRHAKEIYVGDVDGDGTDELYVVLEGRVSKASRELEVEVEVKRYEAGTDPEAGVVIATIPDRLCRFLTVGDVDGDGKKEMVAAAYSSGLWLLRPGEDPNSEWDVSSIDRNSGGFEHASILTDLDADGKDELYVASDRHKEVRRYTWDGSRLVPETIYVREDDGGGVFTWNIMPVPLSLAP